MSKISKKSAVDVRNKISNAVSPNTIDDFKATIESHGGLAKGNRFLLFMTPPKIFRAFNRDFEGLATSFISRGISASSFVTDPRDISMLCESCSLPGKILTVIDGPKDGFGKDIKRASGYNNDEVTLTFHLTNDMYIKKFFDRWQASIVDQESYQLSYPDTYSTDITIQHISDENIPTYGVKLIRAWPSNVQAIDLSSGNTETIKLSVSLAFEDVENEGAMKSTMSGIKSTLRGFSI